MGDSTPQGLLQFHQRDDVLAGFGDGKIPVPGRHHVAHRAAADDRYHDLYSMQKVVLEQNLSCWGLTTMALRSLRMASYPSGGRECLGAKKRSRKCARRPKPL